MSSLSFRLDGTAALVTGGTSGIGKAIAETLLDAGANVVVGSRSSEKVKTAQQELAADHAEGQVIAMPLDVTDAQSIDAAIDTAIEAYGRLDVLVNCAGTNFKKPTAEVEDEEHRDLMEANYFGPFHACQTFARRVADGDNAAPTDAGFSIVNVCSVTSFQGLTEVTPYANSKSALLGLTRQLAVEWPRLHGIRVNAIAPGFVPADQNRQILKSGDRGRRILEGTPMERFGAPEEIAGAVVYLCSPAGRFVNGECINVDGGFLACGVCEAEAKRDA